jgi:hypothetical protein
MISGTAIKSDGRAIVGRMMRAREAVLIASMALASLAAGARAQPEPEPEPESPARPRVLFSMPQTDEQTQAELHDALLAQFALIDADVVLEPALRSSGSLGERRAEAQRRAAERDAIAVFWVEEQPDGRWFVHMMDSARERIVVRPVDAAGERRRAAVEAVALMTRESTRALIEGVPEPALELAPATPEPAPVPAPTVVAPEPRRRDLRLWTGYAGGEFAAERAWRHGVVVGVGWYKPSPLFIGGSIVVTPALDVFAEPANEHFDIGRIPIRGQAGYRHHAGPAVLDLELGLLLEVLYSNAPESRMAAVTISQRDPEVQVGLAPRVRGELLFLPWAGFFAAVGGDVIFNNVEYIVNVEDTEGVHPETVLEPLRLRLVAEAGLAFYL